MAESGESSVSFLVEAEAAGERLDAFLARHDDRYSRNRFKALIKAGHVALGGRTLVEPNTRVNAGDEVRVALPAAVEAAPQGEAIALSVLHEDDDLIVIDKPAGLVVHPAAGNWTGTLVNALIHHCGDSLSGIGGVKRPGIVHRLDKETSGPMVVAKSDRAHRGLAAQFAGRRGELERSYVAFVWGAPDPRKGTIDAAIGRDPKSRLRQAVVRQGGRRAVTHYEVAEAWPGGSGPPLASKVRLRLESGRTHQIRVHMAHVGAPLIGDPLYGAGFRTKANRLSEPARRAIAKLHGQALHAATLGFRHPVTGRLMRFSAPLPKHLQNLEKSLRSESVGDTVV